MKIALRRLALAWLLATATVRVEAQADPPASAASARPDRTPAQFERTAPPAPSDPPVAITGNYDADLNANVSGGGRRGAAYLGKLAFILDADLDRLLAIPHGTAHLSVLNIHGTGLSGHFVDNLTTVSGNEAEPAIRLNQLWLEFALAGKTRLRLGKFTAAQSFMASDTAGFFINSTFGWPASFASDLPSGGPSWPLAAPGAMLTVTPNSRLTLSGAVFSGDPAGPGDGDPQRRDGHGFDAFGFTGKPFVIAEGTLKIGKAAVVKTGGWVHFDRFDALGASGRALPRDWALYALVDAMLYRDIASGRALHGFVRASLSPSDRNPVSSYVDAGVELTAPFAGRPDDAIGIAYARAGLSGRLTAAGLPVAEQVVELSYRAAVAPALSLQPNVQVIIDPVVPDFGSASSSALVLGLRTSVVF